MPAVFIGGQQSCYFWRSGHVLGFDLGGAPTDVFTILNSLKHRVQIYAIFSKCVLLIFESCICTQMLKKCTAILNLGENMN